MRWSMWLITIGLFIVNSIQLLAQYSAHVIVNDYYFRTNQEFRDSMHVDVYFNHIKQEPNGNWYYELWSCDRGIWGKPTGGSGYGRWAQQVDGEINRIYLYTVKIIIDSITIWSDTPSVAYYGTSKEVDFYALRSDNSDISRSLVAISHYAGPHWITYQEGC